MNIFRKSILKLLFLVLLCTLVTCNQTTHEKQRPNVVMVFIDDAGFADFNPFGEPRYPTPNVSNLADEGCSFYNFYVPQAKCSASRAALLSGCYPVRTGVFGAIGPGKPGLDPKYATLGEVLQDNGYVTACFGKWHIGDVEGMRPPSRGFDESCGLMYSNDMWPHHPVDRHHTEPLPYWENGKIVIDTVTGEDQKMLTTWYTEHAVDFINRHSDESFFLYVPHTMAHVPIFCSDKFLGKSGTGLYGDVIMELDWSVGQIMKAIKDNSLEKNTIFIFIGSDNGPWLSYGNHAGQTPYREGKGTIFDGGVRNPCIIKYPDHIESNITSHRTFCSIDILPTICHLTGSKVPENKIDGKNIWTLITNELGAENPHDYYPFYQGKGNFQGVISADGKWKLHLSHSYRSWVKGGKDGYPGEYDYLKIDTALFDMVHDPYEKGNVIGEYPEVADKLIKYAKKHKELFH